MNAPPPKSSAPTGFLLPPSGASASGYFPESGLRSQARWIPYGEEVTIGTFKVRGGGFYVQDRTTRDNAPGTVIRSLDVDPSNPDWHGADVGYYPSYEGLKPNQRAAFLAFLDSDRKNPKIPSYCLWLLYYNIEHRLLTGDPAVGRNTWIANGVSIMDGVRIGENCKVFPGAIVGGVPQDLKFHGDQSILTIGNQVTIREYATLNRGTEANFSTTIKDNCLLMAYVHVAHDCVLEENCILANNVNLAGHIRLGKYVILGGLTAVHQFVQIGEHTMLGGGSLVRKDVPPYVKAAREPLSYAGVNSVGLRRRGFSPEVINEIHNIYRILARPVQSIRGRLIKESR